MATIKRFNGNNLLAITGDNPANASKQRRAYRVNALIDIQGDPLTKKIQTIEVSLRIKLVDGPRVVGFLVLDHVESEHFVIYNDLFVCPDPAIFVFKDADNLELDTTKYGCGVKSVILNELKDVARSLQGSELLKEMISSEVDYALYSYRNDISLMIETLKKARDNAENLASQNNKEQRDGLIFGKVIF